MSTLLLSGWTQPIDALAHLVDDPLLFDYSEYTSADAAIDALKKLSPADAIGWSMGGQLALRAIAAGAIAPKHLTLIGTPYKFVSDDAALKGMDSRTFELFRSSYIADAPRTAERFHGLLAKGHDAMRAILPQLRHHPQVHSVDRFLPWLDDLAAFSLANVDLALVPPTLIIHGMNDAIVPHAQGEKLAQTLPVAELVSLPDMGHVPHVADAPRLRALIADHQAQHRVAA